VLEACDRKVAGELLLLSQQVRLLEFDPSDRGACVRADESLLRSCARLLAVGTAHPPAAGTRPPSWLPSPAAAA
jgi:hypothetical protein